MLKLEAQPYVECKFYNKYRQQQKLNMSRQWVARLFNAVFKLNNTRDERKRERKKIYIVTNNNY